MENKLTLKQEKWPDGFHYKYYVDELGRKQGTLTIYFSDYKTKAKTDKVHAIINFVNDKYVGEVLAFNEKGFPILKCRFNNDSKLNGDAVLNFYYQKLSLKKHFNDGISDKSLKVVEDIKYSFNLKHLKI